MSDASNLGYGNHFPNYNVNNSFVNVSATNNPANFSSNETGLAASGGHGMLGQANNVAAANSCLGGLCNMTTMQKGGKKNIAKYYNRRSTKHHKYNHYNNNRKIMSVYSRHRRHRRTRRRHHRRHRKHMFYGGAGASDSRRSLNRQLALYNRRMASLSRKLARSRQGGGGPLAMNVLSPSPIGGQRGGYHQFMGNVPSTPSYSVANTTLGAANSALANPAPITRLGCEGSSCVDNYNHFTNKGFQLWN